MSTPREKLAMKLSMPCPVCGPVGRNWSKKYVNNKARLIVGPINFRQMFQF